MSTCTFCDSSEIKERMIFRNDLVWVFPTNIPIVPGHLLICPIRHVATVDEITSQELLAIWEMVKQLKPAMQQLYDAEGYNFSWNEAEVGGQSVPHFHLHMLPRKQGDTGILEYEPRQFLYRPGSRETSPTAELVDNAMELKAYLSKMS